jgi:hypothetical protein
MSKDIRKMIDKVKNFKSFLNENIQNEDTNINKLKQLYINNGFSIEDIIVITEEGYFNNIEWLNENTLIVYRSISLPESKLVNFKKTISDGIGQYWSFDKNIEPIWGSNAEYEVNKNERIVDIRCEGYLKLEDIDFEDLLYAFNDDFHHFCDEQEIRGKDGGDTIKVKKCLII